MKRNGILLGLSFAFAAGLILGVSGTLLLSKHGGPGRDAGGPPPLSASVFHESIMKRLDKELGLSSEQRSLADKQVAAFSEEVCKFHVDNRERLKAMFDAFKGNLSASLSEEQRTRLERISGGICNSSPQEGRHGPETAPAPPQERRQAADKNPLPAVISDASNGQFHLSSPAVKDGGDLPKEFTGDGEAATLPLEWTGAPAGVKGYAVIMHHIDPKGVTKWYWTLYNIRADVNSLPRNVSGVGTLGNNSVNGQAGYAPPHSKGPGPKTYVYTVYALSEDIQLSLPPEKVDREALLAAMKGKILASAELHVVYTRGGDGSEVKQVPPPDAQRNSP